MNQEPLPVAPDPTRRIILKVLGASTLFTVAMFVNFGSGVFACESRAELVGYTISPILWCLIVIGLFCIAKRFRNTHSILNIVIWFSLITSFLQCAGMFNRLSGLS